MVSKSKEFRKLARWVCLFSGGLLLLAAALAGQVRHDHDLQGQMIQDLVRAGIKIDDVGALAKLLGGDNAWYAVLAAIALGRLPKDQQAITSLTEVIRDVHPGRRPSERGLWDGAAVEAARTLAKFHETGWIPTARDRLTLFRELGDRLRMAGILASVGCYDGWPIVHENLTVHPFDYSALFELPNFVGMKNADGSQVNLEAMVSTLLPSMAESRRNLAREVISEIRKRRAR